MEVLLTVSLMYGITFSLRDASLLDKVRSIAKRSSFLDSLLSCAFCTGFHSGWLSFLILRGSGMASSVSSLFIGLLLYSFSGASISYFIDTLLLRLEVTPDTDETF